MSIERLKKMKKIKIKYNNVAISLCLLSSVISGGYTICIQNEMKSLKSDLSSKIINNQHSINLLEASINENDKDTQIIKVTLDEVKKEVNKLPK